MERCHNSIQDFLGRAVLTGINQKQHPENCLKIERSGRTRSLKCKRQEKVLLLSHKWNLKNEYPYMSDHSSAVYVHGDAQDVYDHVI